MPTSSRPSRRWILALSVSLLLLPALVRAQAVAYVNMDALFQGYYETVQSNTVLNKQKDLYLQRATEIAGEIDALKKQRDEAREKSLNIALTDAARDASRKDADEKEALARQKDKDLREFVQGKDRELAMKHMELRNEIVKKLTDYIRTYAEGHRLELVLDVSGLTRNLIPTVIYYPKAQDITDTLLAELNRGHEDKLPKPDEAAAAPAEPAPAPVPPPAETAPAPAD
jgi:Skp family chaperone for outer membrane proteins